MKIWMLQIFAWLLALSGLAESSAIAIKVESASRFVHEPFVLRVDVQAEIKPRKVMLADGYGYSVASISEGENLSYNSKDLTTFFIEIVPTRRGIVSIAPIEAQVGEDVIKSAPLRLTVGEPRSADEMVIEVEFSATDIFVGQAVEMRVRWRSSTPFIQFQELVFELPLLRRGELSVYPMEPDVPEKDRICLPVNDQRIIAEKVSTPDGEELRFSYMLVPVQAGVLASSSARLACALMLDKQNSNQYPSYFNNNFFSTPPASASYERLYQSADIAELRVNALPEEGRTPLFCGISGSLELHTGVNPPEVVVGNLLMFEVELSEMFFSGQLNGLPDAVFENLGSSFKLTKEPLKTESDVGVRKFIYALRPLRADITFIPALAVQIFDPKTQRYRTLRSKPIEIKVLPDQGRDFFVPAQIAGDDLMVAVNGVRNNRKESAMLMKIYQILSFLGANAVFFWLVMPLFWLLIRRRVNAIARSRHDPVYARAYRALRVFKRNVGRDEERALRCYLADRFNLCASALTADSCAVDLKRAGLNQDLIDRVRDYLRAIDTVRYSVDSDAATRTARADVAALVKALERGVKTLSLLLLLTPMLVCSATTEAVFESAMTLYAERPDQARPLFIEAALGFEAEQEFFNAGNSWYFAGENGHALAAYLAAESRAPFNRDTLESIDFIRSVRTTVFEEERDGGGGVFSFWHRICRWQIALRLGVLTSLYLISWLCFIGCRLYGRRVPRALRYICCLLMLVMVLTLLYSVLQPPQGVIVRPAEARLGPGYAYSSAYQSTLSAAVEFEWLAEQNDWVQARLPDSSKVWLHKSACVKIR